MDNLLFTGEFIRSVERFRLRAGASSGVRHAEQKARSAGTCLEFRDFRTYMLGDDVRRVDWNVFLRTGRLLTRRYDATRELPLHILLDSSDSMYFEEPPRADAARRVAAAFAVIGLNQGDRPAIYPFGRDLISPLKTIAGKNALPQMLASLSSLRAAGATNMVRSLQRFGALPLRKGVAVIVSDFFDPAGAPAVIEALRFVRHRLVLIQLTRRSDAGPPTHGDWRLLDCENGRAVNVAMTENAVQRYRRAYDAFNTSLAAYAARRRAVLFRIDADGDVLTQLSRLFVDGVLSL